MNISITERENPCTADIDRLPTLKAIHLINDEDKTVALAVENVLPNIAAAIDLIVERLKDGGRLFYVGAGTSGRLGVLDASEIPPTFGVSDDVIQGVIAGGYDALYKATEVGEDNSEAGQSDLQKRGLTSQDAVVGIAASGGTPYTVGALEYAKSLDCFTAAITCVPESLITKAADIAIVPIVGAEVLAGSSRMKAGTAQKMVLNMISTAAMIKLGYVKGNRMTNVKASNAKLKKRSLQILMSETDLNELSAGDLMSAANNDLRVAIVMHKANVNRETAEKSLAENSFVIGKAIERLNQ